MRGLTRLIYKYHVFLVFLLLEVIAFGFLTSYNSVQKSAFLNTSNSLATNLFSFQNRFQSLLELQEVNDSLALELAMMKSRQSDFFRFYDSSFEVTEDSLLGQQFKFQSAAVVNSSTNRSSNFMLIDKGGSSGIKPEMGVIADNALVGLVKDTSSHFATVMPIINVNFKVSVKLKQEGDFGMARWDTKSPLEAVVEDIPQQANINIGDTIVTSGFGSYFPPNVMVGVVSEAEVKEGDSFYTMRIRLATDFGKTRYVEVVENILKEEQQVLEETVLLDE